MLHEMAVLTFVRMKGLEPPRLSTLDPKSSAATNYATFAYSKRCAKIETFFKNKTFLIFFVHFLLIVGL